MRTEREIQDRLRNYEKNLDLAKRKREKVESIRQAILELSWVLGEEHNHKFMLRKGK
jgi:hypothetical protein